MSKNAILAITLLMTTALLGVSAIQFFWINESLKLKEKTFDDQIMLTLSKAKEALLSDMQSDVTIKGLEKKLRTKDKWQREQLEIEIKKTKLLADTNALENITISNVKLLDTVITRELKNHNKDDLEWEYGIYSEKTKSFFVKDGHFVAEFGIKEASSTLINDIDIANTPYSIPIFDDFSNEEPAYLKLFFPRRKAYLIRSLLPIVISSILFTSLILFCFAYTLRVIFKQKKISEIKNDFINNMTHEFKTPIATISLASDSIGSPMIISNEEKVRKFVNIIKAENKRMLNQVEKVLQMAQIEKQEITLKPTKIDINEMVQLAADNATLKVASRDGEITTTLHAKRSVIEADQTHVASIISNLLDNAEKYTKETPHIHIETNDDKDGVKISVTDNGIGMSKEDIKHIFEKFFRVHTGNVHDVKGFGLGLSYVKAIVDAHGGKVSVRSELLKGSTFTIFLPFKIRK